MADNKLPEERSRNMSAIRSKNTKPELLVRKFLFSKGLRYRVNCTSLPGTPDIVFPKYKTVVFIDGCFWHGHSDCRYAKMPKTNCNFWLTKISHNVEHDLFVTESLTALGWRVIRIWQCQLRTKLKISETLENLYKSITQ